MKKKIARMLITGLLIGSIAGISPAMAGNLTPAPETQVIENGGGTVTPQAIEFITYYRDYYGVFQYRIWNATEGYWTMPWTNC